MKRRILGRVPVRILGVLEPEPLKEVRGNLAWVTLLVGGRRRSRKHQPRPLVLVELLEAGGRQETFGQVEAAGVPGVVVVAPVEEGRLVTAGRMGAAVARVPGLAAAL